MWIANIPAEMWLDPALQAARPELVFLGPAPQSDVATRTAAGLFAHIAWHSRSAYVYILLHRDASAIYVGKTRNPVGRFSKHRRREWWSEVHNLVLLRVEADTSENADTLAFHVESLFIKRLCPDWNVVGVDDRPRWKRGVYA